MFANSCTISYYRDLTAFKLPLTIPDSLSYLSNLSQKTILLALYQHYFPDEWASSQVDWLTCTNGCLYSDREIEFLTLVNDRLFPLGEVDNLDRDERLSEILLYPQNTDWYDAELEQLTDTEQFLISVLGCGYLLTNWLEEFEFEPEKLVSAEQIDFEKLKLLCGEHTSPLSLLYDVLSLIDHSTGCIWLDIVWENYECFSWDQKSIDYLTQDWIIAQPYLTKMAEFDQWLQADINNRKEVVELWNNAKK